jgi:outer membrane immunogenic protein
MKIKTYLMATTWSLALVGAASAADLPLKSRAVHALPPAAVWEGPYVGIHGGIGRANFSVTFDNPDDTWTSGATGGIFGGQIGYNWQRRHWVYGVEADASWAGLKASYQEADGDDYAEAKVRWLASFRGRAGLAIDDTLVYATVGLALGGTRHSYRNIDRICDGCGDFGSAFSRTRVGWVAGFGVEHQFGPRWSARLEALYYDLGKHNHTAIHDGSPYNIPLTTEVFVARAGFNYKW